MTNKLFDAILAGQTDPTAGRPLGLALGIVTANNDPMALNRIKVTTGDKGGLSETDWLFNVTIASGVTLPTPKVGSTVVLGYLDADSHKPVYLGTLHNLINPPIPGFTVVLSAGEVFKVVVGANTFTVAETGIRINGKLVAVVGSLDSRNDTIVQAFQ
jgi:hypothetical protein